MQKMGGGVIKLVHRCMNTSDTFLSENVYGGDGGDGGGVVLCLSFDVLGLHVRSSLVLGR